MRYTFSVHCSGICGEKEPLYTGVQAGTFGIKICVSCTVFFDCFTPVLVLLVFTAISNFCFDQTMVGLSGFLNVEASRHFATPLNVFLAKCKL